MSGLKPWRQWLLQTKESRDSPAKQRKQSYIVRSQFNLDFHLHTGCERFVREGLHMCRLQEAARRRQVSTLSLGWLCLATISYLTWYRQSAADHQSPERFSNQMAKGLHQWTAMLDSGKGLLWAGRLWEEPGGIKVTASQVLGFFWLGLFETSLLGLFSFGFLSLVLWKLLWVWEPFESCAFSLAPACFLAQIKSASCPGPSLFLSFLPWLQPGFWLLCPCWPLLALTHS